MPYQHIPVMLEEVMLALGLSEGMTVIDATLGGAGYSLAILDRIGPTGSLYALDADPMAIQNALQIKAEKKLDNFHVINENFRNLQTIFEKIFPAQAKKKPAAIVFDLGLSSAQLKDEGRGFSFRMDAPLDMSFAGQSGRTFQIVNRYKQAELARIIKEYGEERYAPAIAREIVSARRRKQLESTGELLEAVKKAIPNSYINNSRIHFATRTFQALRMATNDELASLEKALAASLELLSAGGRLSVVSFHSLEDRLVKQFIRRESKACLCPPQTPLCVCGHEPRLKIISRKPILPSKTEIKINPRARSAKLRVAEKIK